MLSIIDDIRKKLPEVYNKDNTLLKLLGIIAEQIDIHNERIEDVRAQLYPESATWSLSRWEDELGLKIVANDTVESRRSRVMAKLRIRVPYSAAMLASIAEAFTHLPVKVTVDAERFIIQFTFMSAFITDPNFFEQIDNAIQAHMLPLYQSQWDYDTKIEVDNEYSVYSYSIPSANTFLCGTWPSESTFGRIQNSDVELELTSYEASANSYRLAGKVVVGTDIVPETITLSSITIMNIQGIEETSDKLYNRCGAIRTGEVLA